MKYLLYYRDGFLKKFPLDKTEITVGRSSANDLILEEDDISRSHLQIEVKADHIVLRDLNSTNGVFVQGRRISVAILRLGESFSLNGFSFYLREGSLEEFQLTRELDPVFEYIKRENRNRNSSEETRYVRDVYTEFLKYFLRSGMGRSDFSEFLREISAGLAQLPIPGGLFLMAREKDGPVILLAVNRLPFLAELAEDRVVRGLDVFTERLVDISLEVKEKVTLFSQPMELGKRPAALVYLHPGERHSMDERLLDFLTTLSRELELLFLVIEEAGRKIVVTRESPGETPDIPFVAMDPRMRQLVQQAERIARSDLFVTIQGESGTGKELFARLLHDRSSRSGKRYVAINCAAIPENLLESELFGHEKGAFTGAHARRQGKLELASGGSLILDEIGEMPMGLQVKLLRVLQEHTFYRVGGNEPIHVDLRIISLTNTDLLEAIQEGRFRSDLYYRLAHHRFSIPPLRERRADIPELINFFTRRYCNRSHKNIRGFSVQAFEILQRCNWPGNVRQLENEINRLVNLSDEGGLIGAELISEEINMDVFPLQSNETVPVAQKEPEHRQLLRLLEQNNWNKSRTARELGMTYQGLHKKMKRLGIRRPDSTDS
ncbi:MAG: sigma 54-dependent Fis family transcriptional regulator [Candidatus Aminicenantes bacterium]|nr:sigma 54-dependent Fis family transcriptional regulator [Candidatus Aminicenantes bacterium]